MPLTNEQKMLIEFNSIHLEFDTYMKVCNTMPNNDYKLYAIQQALDLFHKSLLRFEEKWAEKMEVPSRKEYDDYIAEYIQIQKNEFLKTSPEGQSAIPSMKSNTIH